MGSQNEKWTVDFFVKDDFEWTRLIVLYMIKRGVGCRTLGFPRTYRNFPENWVIVGPAVYETLDIQTVVIEAFGNFE